MNREIGFRVWSKKYNKYFKLSALIYENGKIAGILANSGISDDISDIIDLEPEDVVLEQDTGLKDKNGKRICEGDIVKMPDWKVSPKFEVVRFTKLSCGFEPFVNGCMDCMSPDGEEVEVIGNIHENKELLK